MDTRNGTTTRTRRALPVAALLAVLALVAGACGSTADLADQQRLGAGAGMSATGIDDLGGVAPGTGDTGTGTGDGTVATGTATGGTAAAGGGASAAAAGGAATGTSGGAATRSGAAASGAPGASAPGVTATDIKVGLVYDKSAGSTNAALGYSGIGQVDQRRAYDAIIGYINKHGGVAGRKITPVYHEFDSTVDATTPPEVLEQRICTTFTENRVFAATVVGSETLTRCLNEARIVRVAAGGVDEQMLKESPLLVILGVTLDRIARFSVDRLQPRGFYEKGRGGVPGYKLGLVRFDDPEFQRAADVFEQQLQSRGLKLSEEAAIREAETLDQVQDEANSIRAAALKFKQEGITHVQFLGTSSARLQLTFMQSAEKQLYRPRYGLVSLDGGQALATLLGSDADAQLAESLEVGWFPIFDVHRSEYSGDKTTPAFRRCIEILQKAGETFTEGDPTRNKEAIASIYCDELFYFVEAAAAAGPNLTPDTFMEGVKTVDGMDSAMTFRLSTRTRRDAFGAVRDAAWFSECTCFRYTSATLYPV